MPGRLRLPAVLLTAFVAAEVAVGLLRPRDPRPEPVTVDARAYFSERRLAQAEEFRSGQRRLLVARLALEGGLLVLLVARPPRMPVRRRVLAGAAGAAAVSVALTVVALPVSAVARQRSMDVGLVTQSWGGWSADLVRSQVIGAAMAAAGGALLIVGMRRFGRRWWIPGAGVVVAFGIATTYAAPVVLDPLFNRFEPLEQGPLRTDVLGLAGAAGVEVGEVYVMDASRRTTAANAYVAGLGSTKRVVLYDTLLRDFTREEVRLVVAHELAHVRYRDVPNGLLYLAIMAPFGMLAVAHLAAAAGARDDDPLRAVAATALALAVVGGGIGAVSNQLSRAVERRADAYAVELTGRPEAQIAFQKRIAVQNVADVDPPAAWHAVFGTHPTTLERIAAAEAAR